MLRPSPSRPDVLYDARWQGPQGIATFSREVLKRLPNAVPLREGPGLFNPVSFVWLARTISRLSPNVYFTPGFNAPLASSRPFVFVIHDLNYVHCVENSDPFRRAYFKMIVLPASRRAASVLTVSEFSRVQILEWTSLSPDRVVNVSNGVDPAFGPNGPVHAPGYPYVLYVGNRLPHKNLPRLFQAFAAARLECKLLITGSPDAATRALARRCDIEQSVRYAGRIGEKDLPNIYRGALAVVLPSLFEGFGLPLVEAMACAVPVIASNTTAMPEVVGDAGLIFDPRSVDELSDALRRVVLDTALREVLKARGLQRVTRFSWDETSANVRRVLQLAGGD